MGGLTNVGEIVVCKLLNDYDLARKLGRSMCKLSKKNSAKLERIWTTLTNGLTKLRKRSLAKKHFLKMNPALTIKSMECNILFKMWMITIVQLTILWTSLVNWLRQVLMYFPLPS